MNYSIPYLSASISGLRSHLKAPLLSPILILLLLIPILFSCEKIEFGPEVTRQFGSETARVQEMTFFSQKFTIVGDLRMPEEGEAFPVILMIHGSGQATRNGAVPFNPMIEIFLRHGYAVLSWDKPGSGMSEGALDPAYETTENAQIIVDAIEALKENPSIDLTTVGLWGISQGGWIIPKTLTKTDKISFMIVVSGGGEDGIDQGAYYVSRRLECEGGSAEDVAKVEQYWSVMNKATEYDEYKEACEILLDIPGLYENTGLIKNEENNWSPWSREWDAFFDPREVLRTTTIPVLAFFGELDKNVDPVQGFEAYEESLSAAGNPDYQVVMIEGAGHILMPAETGCVGEPSGTEYMPEYLDTLEIWIQAR